MVTRAAELSYFAELLAINLIAFSDMQGPFSSRHSPRGIFCSRTLNLRSISAIGYDMDYTLMHYNVMVMSTCFCIMLERIVNF